MAERAVQIDVPNEIRWVNGIYAINPDFVVLLARNERPAGADQDAGAAAPIWLAALPPYTVRSRRDRSYVLSPLIAAIGRPLLR